MIQKMSDSENEWFRICEDAKLARVREVPHIGENFYEEKIVNHRDHSGVGCIVEAPIESSNLNVSSSECCCYISV